MEYKKPVKLMPLQFHAPFTTKSTMRLISRDQARVRLSSHRPRISVLDACIKSFPRLYYQPALRQSSFHVSLITGKTRIPRKLEPLNYSKTPEKLIETSYIEETQMNTFPTPNSGLGLNGRFDEELQRVELNNEKLEKVEDEKIEKIEEIEENDEKKHEIIENIEEKESVHVKDEEIKGDLEEFKEINQVNEVEKGELSKNEGKKVKVIFENGPGCISWETKQTYLTLESMKIAVEGFDGFLFVPIKQLKYIIFNTQKNIELLIQKFLKVDTEVKWFFYKKKSRKSLKKIEINCNFPFVVDDTPQDPFPESFEFEIRINRGPYSYNSGVSRKVVVYLPKLTYKTEKTEKTSLVSLNNLKGLLKKSSAFPNKIAQDSFESQEPSSN